MNSFSNQRENLLWLTIVLFVFLAETINFAKAYPMIVEVEESSERVSFLRCPQNILLYKFCPPQLCVLSFLVFTSTFVCIWKRIL